MWRWDADLQRWVDDDGVTSGGDAGSETPWWAAEETRAAGVRTPPLQPPPVQPPPPPAHLPPVPQPWQQAGPGFGPAPANVPAPGYQGGPPPSGSGGSWRLIAMVVALVLAVGGIGAGVWVLMRNDAADRKASGGSQPSLSASVSASPADSSAPSPSASATASPSVSAFASVSPEASTRPEPAPGYSRTVDPVGYTLDVPDGWLREQEQGVKAPVVTYYSEVGDSRRIQLFKVTEDSPADSLDQAENQPWGFKKKLSGYEVLNRTSGPGWAELTYHYNGGEEEGPLLVIDHRFTAPDGAFYAIRVSRDEGATSEDLSELLTTTLNSFCPSGATCTGT